MRESYADILATVEKGLQRSKLGDKLASKARLALKILADWDYKYEVDKPQGAVMEAWEYAMGTYMHEYKISDVRIRRTMRTYAATEHFVYKQIAKWAKESETYADYCYMYDLNADNSCQEMVAYTFAKAIEDIETRLGPYTGSNWRMGDLVKSRYEHQFGTIAPLRPIFEEMREHSGNGRTNRMHNVFYHFEGMRFQSVSGSIFRMINDMSEPNMSYLAMDVETDQSRLWNTQKYERGMSQIWNDDDYFKLPTYEVANEPKFQLSETSKKIFLYPNAAPK